MTPQESVLVALTELIEHAKLQGEAVLIGGQALRDWHARELHILDQRPGIPAPRSTTDIDLHLVMPDERERIVPTLESDWTQDERQSFRFHWRRDPTVTLDLISVTDRQARSRVKFLARLSSGTGQVSAVRVLPPWIIACALCETCFTPAYARLGVLRLTHLGLLASKLAAVSAAITAIQAAREDRLAVPDWCVRLAKDLQDLRLLLDRAWQSRLWLIPDAERRRQSHSHLATQLDELLQIRERPTLLAESEWQQWQQLQSAVRRCLDEGGQQAK